TIWLKHFRPDLVVAPLRGNVPTRIAKLREGGYDAIVLAAAGLARLGDPGGPLVAALSGLRTSRLEPRRFVPAPAQGALAVLHRARRLAARHGDDRARRANRHGDGDGQRRARRGRPALGIDRRRARRGARRARPGRRPMTAPREAARAARRILITRSEDDAS